MIARLDIDDLAELVSALSLSSAGLSRNKAAAVIAAMLHSATVDPLIPRAIIQASLPGILGLARRIDATAPPWRDLDAFYGDAVSCCSNRSRRGRGRGVPTPPETSCPGSGQAADAPGQRSAATAPALDSSAALDAAAGSIGPSGEELLAAAIFEAAGDGLAASEGAVLYATRVLGLPLVEVAELTGISVRRLGRQRSHAMAFVVV